MWGEGLNRSHIWRENIQERGYEDSQVADDPYLWVCEGEEGVEDRDEVALKSMNFDINTWNKKNIQLQSN